ncbi:universal stress protein [Syntrophorhabdus aromaticivorans]|uniref:Universal stress protein n=1 Tax=Syntrophorhabdus aromaticivorans TaxID=328301 RepID=A0A351U3C2_9BACT|nr:universal stress protein [Syntrophorhabdus aromaticivorans]NLW35378.1 universal stress protein [Syntrophorhabdus aromaticivorans]HBA54453.1 universal stress protein [Syntrophorhabdus aromaticivorans]
MLIPTKILVPTDFSEYSSTALAQAFDVAKEYNAKVYVLHVIHETLRRTLDGYILNAEDIKKIERDMVKNAKKNLQDQVNKFPLSKEVEVFTEIANGNPSDEILKAQKEKGIDLIVISSLGRSGLARYLIGSVARNVLKSAECPVLLTK